MPPQEFLKKWVAFRGFWNNLKWNFNIKKLVVRAKNSSGTGTAQQPRGTTARRSADADLILVPCLGRWPNIKQCRMFAGGLMPAPTPVCPIDKSALA